MVSARRQSNTMRGTVISPSYRPTDPSNESLSRVECAISYLPRLLYCAYPVSGAVRSQWLASPRWQFGGSTQLAALSVGDKRMTDRRIQLTRRKILGAAGTVGAAGVGAGLGTSALFSDEESFGNNQFTAGTLNLEAAFDVVSVSSSVSASVVAGGSSPVPADNTEDPNPFDGSGSAVVADGTPKAGIQFDDVKPGDSLVLKACARVTGNPGYVRLVAKNVFDGEDTGDSFTEPEGDTSDGPGEEYGVKDGGVDPDQDEDPNSGDNDDDGRKVDGDDDGIGGTGELDNVANVTVGTGFDSSTGAITGVDSSLGGSLNQLLNDLQDGDGIEFRDQNGDLEEIGPDGQDCVYIRISIPKSAGNVIQGDSVSADLVFQAAQVRNNTANPFSPFDTSGSPLVVSKNPGPNQFGSIQSAVNAVTSTTILVEPGTYNESVSIPGGNSASNVQGLIIKSTEGPGVTTIDASGQDGDGALRIDDVNGVTINGFEITNADGAGIEVRGAGASDLTITNSVVTNNGDEGIDIFGGTVGNVSITNSVIDENGSTGLFVGSFGGGIFDSNSEASSITVENVSASNNAFDGILVSSEAVPDLTLRNVAASNNGNDGIDIEGVNVSKSTVARVTAANNGGAGLVAGSLVPSATVTGQFRRLLVDSNGANGDFSGVEVFDGTEPATSVEVDKSRLVNNAGFGAFTDDGDPRSAVDADVFLSNVSLSDNEVASDGDQVSEGVKIESKGAPSDVGADL